MYRKQILMRVPGGRGHSGQKKSNAVFQRGFSGLSLKTAIFGNAQIVFVLFLLLCTQITVFADVRTITLGGGTPWQPFSVSRRITGGSGVYGYPSIQLASDSRTVSKTTDLLLSFEQMSGTDDTGQYNIFSNYMLVSPKPAMGKKSGMSRGAASQIKLSGENGTLFGTAGLTGSFAIDFWLCPAIAENGEQILYWRSSQSRQGYPLYQLVSVSVFNNRLEWKFTNFFNDGKLEDSSVVLTGYSSLVPDVWAHHVLTYNDESGALEYLVNGRTEAIVYVTSTGRERGTVYPAEVGRPAELILCPQFTGLIDEFCVSRGNKNAFGQNQYPLSGGRFETMPLKTAGPVSVLQTLNALVTQPEQTAVQFFVRGGDNFYEWTDSSPAWHPVVPGEPINGVQGLYFQVAADLYTDGGGSYTPSVSGITLVYAETEPPLPPVSVTAVPGNGYIDVSWSVSADSQVNGYLIYYGEKQGEYLGFQAVEGRSPVDTGKAASFRLSGLSNGKIYYIAIAAYTQTDRRITGSLSREVYARPLKVTP